ncbi:MAG: glutamate-5-semialdehyde dehydrogenase [Candidatus Bathyarchaeota archaeon]
MTTMIELGKRAKAASIELAKLPAEVKNRAIVAMAKALEKKSKEIIIANKKDVEAAQMKGIKAALLDRLVLDESRIRTMAQCLRDVVALPDPVNQIVRTWIRPNGLIIGQLRVPLGVVGIIYESRPDVTSDASGICMKSGNAVILRGGSDAINSNIALGDVLAEAAVETGVPRGAIQVVRTTDRRTVEELMRLSGYVDVLIPRGGADLIQSVVKNSRVPVIETGIGNCHIYVDNDADLEEVTALVLNSKCQRPGTCNAAEKLLIHQKIAENFLPKIVQSLRDAKVEVRGDAETRRIVPDVKVATDEDWYAEYLDLIIGIKVVPSIDAAINHINKYGSKHTDAILTRDFHKALRFIKEVDSASVNWNASTRFTDGNQYGLGAEIGISTQKIHARGPLSVEHLTTIKYFVLGRGHIRK